MRRIPAILVAVFVTSSTHAGAPMAQRIFDGRILSGWEGNERYRITATASHMEIRVNDVLTAVLDDRKLGAARFDGRLAFQLHAAGVFLGSDIGSGFGRLAP